MPSSPTDAAKPGLMAAALMCRCPRCRKGAVYAPGFLNLNLNEKCPECGLPIAKHDNGDGPAVFMIFVLGFSLVPMAFVADHFFHVATWAIISVLAPAGLGITVGGLRPLKAYVMALQYKHRPDIWERS
jgi:uncharacterized protein (DUF983 family)